MVCPVYPVAFVRFKNQIFPTFEFYIHRYGLLVTAGCAFQFYLFAPIFSAQNDAIAHNRCAVGSIFVGFGVHAGHRTEMRHGTVELHHDTRFGVYAHTAFVGCVVDHQRVIADALVGANHSPAVRDVFQVHRTERNVFRSALLAHGKFHNVSCAHRGFRDHFRLLRVGRAEKVCIGPVEVVGPIIVVAEGGFQNEEFTAGQIHINCLTFVAALHHARGFHLARAVLLDEHHVVAHNTVVGFVVCAVVYPDGGLKSAHALVEPHHDFARSVNAQTGVEGVAGNAKRATAHTLVELDRHVIVAVGGVFEVDGAQCDHLFGGAAGRKREVIGQRRCGGQRHREEARE